MSKFYLNISEQEQYTDNRLGHLFQGMLCDSHNDALVVFKDHVISVEYDKEDDSFVYESMKITRDKIEESHIEVESGFIQKKNMKNHKDIGYHILKMFRYIYPEYNDKRFPVTEIKIWFVKDLFSHLIDSEE